MNVLNMKNKEEIDIEIQNNIKDFYIGKLSYEEFHSIQYLLFEELRKINDINN